LLTVQKVSVLPFTDNLQGIYARPLEAHFIQLIEKMHRWDYVPASLSGPILTPEEMESSVDKAHQASQGLGADAFFATRVTKGPNGVTVHMSFFLTKDGKLLSQAILKEYKQFNIESLKEQVQQLLSEIVSHLPYSGRVLSRDGNRITVNLGLRDGIQVNQMLNVIQILQVQRHPKFNFLVKTEKEIFGKIKVLKVDETLSFCVVITEKDKGAIQKNSKIGSVDFVTYADTGTLSQTPSPEEALTQREDGGIAFGKDARAWQPQHTPTFGEIGGTFGLSRFTENAEVGNGVGGLASASPMAPSIAIFGELWVTQEWTFFARLRQGIIPINNPRPNSTPTTLNQAMSYYEGGLGFVIRLGPYVWSPTVQPYLSGFSYRLYVDDTSPEAFTTLQYSGMKLGVRGSTPISVDGIYGVGGEFSMAYNPTAHESPKTSGDSAKHTVIQFGLLGFKRLSPRLKIQATLDFEMYSSSFSGAGTRTDPASSISQRFTTLSGGVFYAF
jgi:hypothetical protein